MRINDCLTFQEFYIGIVCIYISIYISIYIYYIHILYIYNTVYVYILSIYIYIYAHMTVYVCVCIFACAYMYIDRYQAAACYIVVRLVVFLPNMPKRCILMSNLVPA